jgi:hypothetical protein
MHRAVGEHGEKPFPSVSDVEGDGGTKRMVVVQTGHDKTRLPAMLATHSERLRTPRLKKPPTVTTCQIPAGRVALPASV